MAHRLVTARPFTPALRLAGRPGAELAALAALVDGDPDDLESILSVLGRTDARMRDAAGAFAALPPADQYHGPSAAAVMMPFLSPRESRFSAGLFGLLYGAESTDTAVAEVSYHHGRRLRAAAAPAGTTVVLALWAFTISGELADVRAHDLSVYHPTDYSAARSLGRQLRADGATGLFYASVRRGGGECVGILVPRVVRSMAKRDDWRLIWDGSAISEVLRAA